MLKLITIYFKDTPIKIHSGCACCELLMSIEAILEQLHPPQIICNPDNSLGLIMDPEYPTVWLAKAAVQHCRCEGFTHAISALISLGHQYQGPPLDLCTIPADELNELLAVVSANFLTAHPTIASITTPTA